MEVSCGYNTKVSKKDTVKKYRKAIGKIIRELCQQKRSWSAGI